jgi:hypothetical protein
VEVNRCQKGSDYTTDWWIRLTIVAEHVQAVEETIQRIQQCTQRSSGPLAVLPGVQRHEVVGVALQLAAWLDARVDHDAQEAHHPRTLEILRLHLVGVNVQPAWRSILQNLERDNQSSSLKLLLEVQCADSAARPQLAETGVELRCLSGGAPNVAVVAADLLDSALRVLLLLPAAMPRSDNAVTDSVELASTAWRCQ